MVLQEIISEYYSYILIAVCIILLFVIPYFRKIQVRCPKCRMKGGVREIDSIELGKHFKREDVQQYRKYYKCLECKAQWSNIEYIDKMIQNK